MHIIQLTPSTLKIPNEHKASPASPPRGFQKSPATRVRLIGKKCGQDFTRRIDTNHQNPQFSTARARPRDGRNGLKLSASQPELPSTIPDSVKDLGIMSTESQSQCDTQPISQSVYDEFMSRHKSLHRNGGTFGNAVGLHIATASTYHEGQTGHVDLVGIFEHPSVVANENGLDSQNGDDIDRLSQMEVPAEIYPESMRFQQPKTPGTTGKKRSYRGDIVEPSSTTPRLPVNPFANQAKGNGPMMNLSQVFNATQAPSSPVGHVIPSEGLQERPSPDMYSVQRLPTSSLHSSPVKVLRSGLQRAITEPQTTYVSMKDSQAERERRLRAQQASNSRRKNDVENSSDDDFEIDSSQIRKQKYQKRIKAAVEHQLQSITAPPRISSSDRGRSNLQPGVRRLAKTPQSNFHEAIIIPDETPIQGRYEDGTEDETEMDEDVAVVEAELTDELAEDNKENVGIQVPMTTMRTPRKIFPSSSSQVSPLNRHKQLLSSPVRDEVDELGSEIVYHEIFDSEGKIDATSKKAQMVAVVDSQPSQSDGEQLKIATLVEAGIPAHVSSHESRLFVPQSQSNFLQTSRVDSSMVRRLAELGSLSVASIPPAISSPGRSILATHKYSPRDVRIDSKKSLYSPMSVQRQMSQEPLKIFNSSPPLFGPKVHAITTHKGTASSASEEIDSSTGNLDTLAEMKAPTSERGALDPGKTLKQPNDIGSEADIVQIRQRRPSHTPTPRSMIPETSSVGKNSALKKCSLEPVQTSIVSIQNSSQKSSRLSPNRPLAHPQSNESSLFETAHTQLSRSPLKSYTNPLRLQSALMGLSSKPTMKRPRTFIDIAGDPTPLDEIGDVDVDVGLVTSDDVQFQAIIEGSSPIGPTRKRRRGKNGRILQGAEPESKILPSALHPQPLSFTGIAQRSIVGGEHSSIQAAPQEKYYSSTPTVALKPMRVNSNIREKPVWKQISKMKPREVITNDQVKSKSKNAEPTTRQDFCGKTNVGPAFEPTRVQSTSARAVSEKVMNRIAPQGNIIAPNRVFARFNGNCAAYYPATCIGVVRGEDIRYKVRFDDGTIDLVGGYSVKRLELRVGDNVKIDRQGARQATFVVRSLSDKQRIAMEDDPYTPSRREQRRASSNISQVPYTDVHGHATVFLTHKQLRSLPRSLMDDEQESVPIRSVYLTQTMWTNFKDRAYSYQSSHPIPTNGLGTPSERPPMPSTPSSRNRRIKASVQSRPLFSDSSTLSHSGSSLFENVVFAITNIEDQDLRKRSMKYIQSNGGRLLESGFDELFLLPDLEPLSSSEGCPESTQEPFRLTLEATSFGFTCLIADKHCRTAKYLQTLALGIPCLATRWIEDCVNKQRLVPWEPYLLPSGESTFLNGAVRSRLLPSSSPDSVLLSTIIDGRPKFLAGCSILLITGKGKENEMMKAYPLIANALGASKVSRAVSLEAGRKAIMEAEVLGNKWDWVYFYEGDKQSEKISEQQAEKILFGADGGRKKRKRRSEVVHRGSTRVVGKEFVIQSLILGQLLDSE
ncbi:hypothetical protein MMC06_002375 [Schaereria dolodes]|nr:hypothetical protein [Schaereria dolodes]